MSQENIVRSVWLIVAVFFFFKISQTCAWPVDSTKEEIQIWFNSTRGEAIVSNPTDKPLSCHGQVFGRTVFGQTKSTWIESIVLSPGEQVREVVRTTFVDPFVDVWAEVQCSSQ